MDADDRIKALEALEILQGLLLEREPELVPESLTRSRRRVEMVQAAKTAIALRAVRRQVMGPHLSSDPCWDLLLCLYTNWAEGAPISVTDLAHETGTPTATVTRWLSALVSQGMVERDYDPTDGRRVWIKLRHTAITKIEEVMAAQAFGGYCRRKPMPLAA